MLNLNERALSNVVPVWGGGGWGLGGWGGG